MNKNKPYSILFLQLAEYSFEEAHLLLRVAAQMPEHTQMYAMVNAMSSALVASRSSITLGLVTEHQDNNRYDLEVFLANVQPHVVVILDLHKYFTHPDDLNILPEWLKTLEVPVIALDYFRLLNIDEMGNVVGSGAGSPPLDVSWHIVRPSPPNPPELPVSSPRIHYWNVMSQPLVLGREVLREQLRQSLQLAPDVKVVTLVYDPLLFQQAMDLSIPGFYFAAIEVLCYYLRQFPKQRFELLIAGFSMPAEQLNPLAKLNVHLRYFTHLTDDIAQTLVSGSDLLVLNSVWSCLHGDALQFGTPTAVLANSIRMELNEAGERVATGYANPILPLYRHMELMSELNSKTPYMAPLFQFLNYPISEWDELPPTGLNLWGYPVHVLDMFDDMETLPIIEKMLFEPEYLKEYLAICRRLTERNVGALFFETILQKLSA
jgi:hypothetical protein